MSEVGEAVMQPYKFNLIQNTAISMNYEFRTAGDQEYHVYFQTNIDYRHPDDWYMGFDASGYDDSDVTNENDVYKIMSTLTAVVQDFINQRNPEVLVIEPSKFDTDDLRREKLYMAYVKKQLPPQYITNIVDDKIYIINKEAEI